MTENPATASAGLEAPSSHNGEGGSPQAPSADKKGALVKSYIVEGDQFARVTGVELNPGILKIAPQGNRIIVAIAPIPEKIGSIILSEDYRARERSGAGWVISCGPLVGTGCPHPNGPLTSDPGALLYKKINFGAWVGKPIRVEFLDRKTKAPYLCMTDRDIWAIDWNTGEQNE